MVFCSSVLFHSNLTDKEEPILSCALICLFSLRIMVESFTCEHIAVVPVNILQLYL